MYKTLRFCALCTLILGSTACSDASFDGLQDTDRSPDLDTDTDTGTERPVSAPTLWELSGTLTIADGTPSAVDSSLQVGFFDSEGTSWRVDEEQDHDCTLTVTEVATVAPPADDSTVLQWWSVSVQEDQEAPCPWDIPVSAAVSTNDKTTLLLGLGLLDARLLPAIDAAELNTDADVYGLYLLHPSADGDQVYTFGVGGTPEHFEGSTGTVDAAPLPDGSYALTPLFLLPVPE